MIHPLELGTLPPEQKTEVLLIEVYQQERRPMAKKQAANSGYTPSYKQPIARSLTLFAPLLKEAFKEGERVGKRLGKIKEVQ